MIQLARRLGLGAACALLAASPAHPQDGWGASVSGELKRWHRVTLTFDGPETSEWADPNPFLYYRLNVTFTRGKRRIVVPGFYAADGDAGATASYRGGKWRVHFLPDEVGTWSYAASFRKGMGVATSLDEEAGTATAFDGARGSFDVVETDKTGRDHRHKGLLRYVGNHHLEFAGTGEPFLKGGADSPENLLGYAEFDGTYDVGGIFKDFLHRFAPHVRDWRAGDPTWRGGKGKGIIGALNYLAGKGINSVYFLTYNLDGGDGQDTWPWHSHDGRRRFDCSKLDQWEVVFSHMDRLGIQLHVVTQEAENDQKLGGSGDLNEVRKLYYRELAARFAHHHALIWNLGEENRNTPAQRKAFAAYIRALDPYDHPITVHTLYGKAEETYGDLLGDPHFEATSIQGDGKAYNRWARTLRDRSARAGRKWAIYGDEQGPPVEKGMGNLDLLRREVLWGNLMGGGAGVEWYFAYQEGLCDLRTEDWRVAEPLWEETAHALHFFQTYLPFAFMEPADPLASRADARVLALPGDVYAVYLPSRGPVKLQVPEATFGVQWYDPRAGGPLQEGSVKALGGPGSVEIGEPPGDDDKDWVALIRRIRER